MKLEVLSVTQEVESQVKVIDQTHVMKRDADQNPILDKRGNYTWSTHGVESYKLNYRTLIHCSLENDDGNKRFIVVEKNRLKMSLGAAAVCAALHAYSTKRD